MPFASLTTLTCAPVSIAPVASAIVPDTCARCFAKQAGSSANTNSSAFVEQAFKPATSAFEPTFFKHLLAEQNCRRILTASHRRPVAPAVTPAPTPALAAYAAALGHCRLQPAFGSISDPPVGWTPRHPACPLATNRRAERQPAVAPVSPRPAA